MLFCISKSENFPKHMASMAPRFVSDEKVNSPLHLDQLFVLLPWCAQGWVEVDSKGKKMLNWWRNLETLELRIEITIINFKHRERFQISFWYPKPLCAEKQHLQETKKNSLKKKWVWTQQWTKHLSKSDNKKFYTFRNAERRWWGTRYKLKKTLKNVCLKSSCFRLLAAFEIWFLFVILLRLFLNIWAMIFLGASYRIT